MAAPGTVRASFLPAGLSCLALFGLLAPLPACGVEPERPPSVILVSLDTLRPDHMGLYGYPRDTTPYLEKLAREALVFERAYAPSAWTLISHMTMLTGLHPRQHGVVEKDKAVAPEVPLLAERLQATGYRTVALYHPGWIDERHGFDRGFELFRPHEDAEQAGQHLAEVLAVEDERPLFLFVHLFDIHARNLNAEGSTFYEPPAPYDAAFLPDASERMRAASPERRWFGEVTLGPEQVEALVALYDGGIRYVDDRLEAWVEDWRQRGLLDEALLIVTSDHGEALAQRGKLRGHGGFYEEGLRIPLLVRLPEGRMGGQRRSDPVALVDLVPTILDELGLPPAPLPGYDLTEVVAPDRVLLAERDSWRTLIQGPVKLVEARGGTARFDLQEDPRELQPLAVDEQALGLVRRRLQQALERQEAGRRPARAEALDIGAIADEDLDRLRSLGYLEGGTSPEDSPPGEDPASSGADRPIR